MCRLNAAIQDHRTREHIKFLHQQRCHPAYDMISGRGITERKVSCLRDVLDSCILNLLDRVFRKLYKNSTSAAFR